MGGVFISFKFLQVDCQYNCIHYIVLVSIPYRHKTLDIVGSTKVHFIYDYKSCP